MVGSMSTTFDDYVVEAVTLNDIATDGFAPDDGYDYHCSVCGKGIVRKSNRGRAPTKCDEHKQGGVSSAPKSKQPQTLTALKSSLIEMYTGLGMAVMFVSNDDGMDIINNADRLASSWITLAQTNEKVKKMLQRITTGSGAGAVIFAHVIVAYPILARHDMLPTFVTGNKGDNE
jgi:hypothetical protein